MKYTKDFKIATDTGAAGSTYTANFGNLVAGTGVTTIPEILKELFLAPVSGVTHTGAFWINNEDERLPFVSGSYNYPSSAGPSALNLNNPRSNVRTNIGFFSAYPFSQTGKFTDFSQCKKGKRDLFQFRP